MRVTTGKVVNGKVVVEGERLAEGATVTVVAAEDQPMFELGPEEETELLEAIEQVRHGEVVDGDELLGELGGGD
ncbi:MAG: hypothetical protein ACE5HV_07540 [Acidobacteriota bacterium]